MKNLSDEALKSKIAQIGKDMTSSSSTMAIAKEKERMIYVKELFKRNLAGYRCKKKYYRY